VATRLMCGVIFNNHANTYLLQGLLVQEFWKSVNTHHVAKFCARVGCPVFFRFCCFLFMGYINTWFVVGDWWLTLRF